MKYTIIGDPHIKPSNLNQIEKLFKLVEKKNNTAIWLGDMLDTKEIVRSKCLNLVYDYLKSSKLTHHILVGNHDWHNLSCEDHALKPLNELENVTIHDKPTIVDGILMMPYIHSTDDFKAVLNEMSSKASFLVMHQGVIDFDYGNGMIETSGIDLSELKDFKRVIAGHFHKYQEKDNLVFLGTPFSHSFGETNQTKYIAIFDDTKDFLKLVESKFPQHRTIDLEVNEENAKEQLDEQLNKKDIFRVILRGTEEAIAAFNTKDYPKIKFIEKPDFNEVTESKEIELMDNISKFVKWASDIKKMEPDTINIGLEILEKVQS